MEFIHTADWHLGYRFSQFSKEQNKLLKQAQWQTVESIFKYAGEHNIAFIVCAGDQFENGETTDNEQLLKLFALINRYPKINVIMIAGNHDPLCTSSIYLRVDKSIYPSNLYFAETQSVFEFNEYKLCFFACSLSAKNGTENPLAWVDITAKKEWFCIGVAHGSVKIQGKYNPEDFPSPSAPCHPLQNHLRMVSVWEKAHDRYCKKFYTVWRMQEWRQGLKE